MRTSALINKTTLQERAYEAVKAALGDRTPEGRYALGILKTKARHAQARATTKLKRSFQPGGFERQEWRKARDKVDAEFSRFIRLRDTVLHPGATVRVGHCVTCGNLKPWEHLQCGHWIKRGFFGTRWSEWNCHAQCDFCNDPKRGGGREPEHEAAIKRLHGEAMPDRLRAEKKLKARRPHLSRLVEMAKEFKARADAIS